MPDANTLAELNFNASATQDEAGILSWSGSAYRVTSPTKYGSGALRMDYSANNSITAGSPSIPSGGFSQYCIEFWAAYYGSGIVTGAGAMIPSNGMELTAFYRPDLGTTRLYYQAVDYSGGIIFVGNPYVNVAGLDGNWHHYAFSFDGSWYRLFVDGTLVWSSNTTTKPGYSGASQSIISNGGFEGSTSWIDNVRASNVARYTANFTPGDFIALASAAATETVDVASATATAWPFCAGTATIILTQSGGLDGAELGASGDISLTASLAAAVQGFVGGVDINLGLAAGMIRADPLAFSLQSEAANLLAVPLAQDLVAEAQIIELTGEWSR